MKYLARTMWVLPLVALASGVADETRAREAAGDDAGDIVVDARSPEAAGSEPGSGLVKVTLTDGQTLRGKIVGETEEAVTVELPSGVRSTVPRSAIAALSEERAAYVSRRGTVRLRDPNRTRYFYAPSAMMLEPGEGYVSQKELLFTSVAVGVTPNLSLLAGAAIPAWFIGGGYGLNAIVGAKVGGQVADRLHLAAGFEAGGLHLPAVAGGSPDVLGAVLPFGSLTWGDRDLHATISVSKPFTFQSGQGIFPDASLLVVLAANLRISDRLALVTENWLTPRFSPLNPALDGLGSFGVRFLGERLAVDVGFIVSPPFVVPIPWLDFTYNWGN